MELNNKLSGSLLVSQISFWSLKWRFEFAQASNKLHSWVKEQNKLNKEKMHWEEAKEKIKAQDKS